MANRIRLQPIKLIQHTVDRRIRDEMIHIAALIIPILRRGRLINERRRARERIMRSTDSLAVREGLAAEIGREARGEIFEGAQFGANVDRVRGRGGERVVVVEDHGEDGLRAAGVLNGLRREEGRVGVVGGGFVFAVLGVFGVCCCC